MAGEEIRLGPFAGGLDTFSDPTAISDTSLAEMVNFELDTDGSLVNRPPIAEIASIPGTVGSLKLLGYYTAPGNSFRLIATNQVDKTYWFDGTTWNTITDVAFTAVVQYRDDLWLITSPDSSSNGGKWSPTSGFSSDANMPKGHAIIAHKDRLFVAPGKNATTNGTRMYMSTIVSAGVSWPSSKVFVNIGAGDGENIVDVMVYNSDIIVFKERSTHRFSFSTDPAQGYITRISATIGAAESNCVVEYQNQIYVLYRNKVFMFANYNYDELNTKVPLEATNPSELLYQNTSLSIWADRLIVQYYNSTYVFKLKTQTWSMWRSQIPGLEFIGQFLDQPNARADMPTAYVTSSATGERKLYRIIDAITENSEVMECYFVTKNYDYQSASKFKRLFWWGAEVVANVSLTCEATPISFSGTITWGQAATKTWGELLTWGRPLETSLSVVDNIPVEGKAYGRKFVKIMKSLRFRQINFKISGITSGDTLTAPLRVFNISTWVSDKMRVSKKIS